MAAVSKLLLLVRYAGSRLGGGKHDAERKFPGRTDWFHFLGQQGRLFRAVSGGRGQRRLEIHAASAGEGQQAERGQQKFSFDTPERLNVNRGGAGPHPPKERKTIASRGPRGKALRGRTFPSSRGLTSAEALLDGLAAGIMEREMEVQLRHRVRHRPPSSEGRGRDDPRGTTGRESQRGGGQKWSRQPEKWSSSSSSSNSSPRGRGYNHSDGGKVAVGVTAAGAIGRHDSSKVASKSQWGDLGTASSPQQEAAAEGEGEAGVLPVRGGHVPFHPFPVHSYSETPRVAPIGLRGPLISPFGPESWTSLPYIGGAPRATKKGKGGGQSSMAAALREVLKNGRSAEGKTPDAAAAKMGMPMGAQGEEARGGEEGVAEERDVLGAPLSEKEVVELVKRSNENRKQVSLGRDGVVHNMLELMHNHWQRSPVCRVKCKGVPTVDMDNVVQTIEERTGGKVIQRAGGVLHVFRGRHYDRRLRPRIPLMLWKPPAPKYPPLVVDAPGGLTLEQANMLRVRGRRIPTTTKLGKNGVYLRLVAQVRDALEQHLLCKVDCRGLNPSDMKRIGAKLRDLVPCVLLSFEREQILMMRPLGPEGLEALGRGEKGQEAVALDESADATGESSTTDVSGGQSNMVHDELQTNDLEADLGHQDKGHDEVYFV